jgi:hypothetical protein
MWLRGLKPWMKLNSTEVVAAVFFRFYALETPICTPQMFSTRTGALDWRSAHFMTFTVIKENQKMLVNEDVPRMIPNRGPSLFFRNGFYSVLPLKYV